MPLNMEATLVILKLAMLLPMMRILLFRLDMPRVMRSDATVVTGEWAGRVQTRLTDGLGVLICLPLGGHARVLTVVGKLMCDAMCSDGV